MKKYFPIIAFILLIIFFIVKDCFKDHELKKDSRYSSGIFYKISSSVDGGPLGEYEFKFNNKRFTGNIVLNNKKTVDTGIYYLVIFNPDNPNNCRIDIEKEILLENVKAMPNNGWETMPSFKTRVRIPEW